MTKKDGRLIRVGIENRELVKLNEVMNTTKLSEVSSSTAKCTVGLKPTEEEQYSKIKETIDNLPIDNDEHLISDQFVTERFLQSFKAFAVTAPLVQITYQQSY